ncbi:MAG TPA: hypothetical protein VLZ89_16440 [Anaerolineales bacterium]|nr:hypothetical protein [Anaerolineales bacterium]
MKPDEKKTESSNEAQQQNQGNNNQQSKPDATIVQLLQQGKQDMTTVPTSSVNFAKNAQNVIEQAKSDLGKTESSDSNNNSSSNNEE